jgi:hypothetical protein
VHAANILHNVMKLETVLLTEGFEDAVLSDCEVSNAVGGATTTVVGGTPAYMAPERRLPTNAKPTAKSDMYSVGVLLLLAFNPELIEEVESQHMLVEEALAAVATRMDRDFPELHPLLKRLTSEDPNDRYTIVQLLEKDFFRHSVGASLWMPPYWTESKDCQQQLSSVEVPEQAESFERKMKASAKVTAATRQEDKMDRLRVHRVVRVENPQLFGEYQRKRDTIHKRIACTRAEGNAVEQWEQHAPAWLTAKDGFPAVIDPDSNEFWLWHGTSAGAIEIKHPDGTAQRQEVWRILAEHGFDERVGGATNGGLYGMGSYFSDAASKANQYSTAPNASAPTNAEGHHCMLYCRVTMGDSLWQKGAWLGSADRHTIKAHRGCRMTRSSQRRQ